MMRKLAMVLATFVVSGCMVGPAYQRPDVALPSSYPEALPAEKTTAGSDAISSDWWTLFGDPTLNELVANALDGNRDIQLAIARIEEANANVRAVNAAFLPEVDVTAGAARAAIPQGASMNGASVSNTLRLGLSSAFELDFWGRLRSGVQAARALALASRDAADVVRITTAALTAQTYFAVRALDSQIATTQATLDVRTQALGLVRRRADAGVASDLDVAQSEGARADAAAQLKELVRQRAIASHAPGILTGRLDVSLDRGDLMKLPDPALPPPGLPSTLLARRPDIRQAEEQLIAANARIGVARAEMFPSISLTAFLGSESAALSNLFAGGAAATWQVAGAITQPIFQGGRLLGNLDLQQARERAAVEQYRQAIRAAFGEVRTALIAQSRARESYDAESARADALTESLRLARLRYQNGVASQLDVIDAERGLLAARIARIEALRAHRAAIADLFRALGG